MYDKMHICQYKLVEILITSCSLKQIISHIKFLGEPLTLICLLQLSWYVHLNLENYASTNSLAKIFEILIKHNFLIF